MSLNKIYLKNETSFSTYIESWAGNNGIDTDFFDPKTVKDVVDGLLIINANQELDKELDEMEASFDLRHIPIQRIDINGTMQVAINSLKLWLNNHKCQSISIIGTDDLLSNENLDRFFMKLNETIASK